MRRIGFANDTPEICFTWQIERIYETFVGFYTVLGFMD